MRVVIINIIAEYWQNVSIYIGYATIDFVTIGSTTPLKGHLFKFSSH